MCMMDANRLELVHERVDDIPLIIGLAQQLRMPEILDRHLGNHGSHQGLRNGWLAVGWLAYILSEGDHRKYGVQEWGNQRATVLARLLQRPIRAVEFADDRLGGMLTRLSKPKTWQAIESDLWHCSLAVYDLACSSVRVDSTTVSGYHMPTPEGVMQYSRHSKDHRPDLAQLKLIAAAAQPVGHVLAGDVVAGQAADDPLYLPLIARVQAMLRRSGLLYVGDSKMAALATRASITAHKDYYLVPLPSTGETGKQIEAWVDAVVSGEQAATLCWDGERLLGGGYQFERPLRTRRGISVAVHRPPSGARGPRPCKRMTVGAGSPRPAGRRAHATLISLRVLSAAVAGERVEWTERVQVVRSLALARQQAQSLGKRLAKAEAALWALTPVPGKGKRQIREEAALQAAVASVLEQYGVTGMLDVSWQPQEKTRIRYVGPGRPGAKRPTYQQTQVRYVVTAVERDEAAVEQQRHRLGFRVQATTLPKEKMSLEETVVCYRGGWCLEREFHLLKDRPLGISPLHVWRDDQIIGLTHLLMLALRLFSLIEMRVRDGLTKEGEHVEGIYEGLPTHKTDRPTAPRILRLFARAQITLTRVDTGAAKQWHITPLSPILQKVVAYSGLSPSLYQRLAGNLS